MRVIRGVMNATMERQGKRPESERRVSDSRLLVAVVEPLAVFGLAYFAYILAELFHFSGIIR